MIFKVLYDIHTGLDKYIYRPFQVHITREISHKQVYMTMKVRSYFDRTCAIQHIGGSLLRPTQRGRGKSCLHGAVEGAESSGIGPSSRLLIGPSLILLIGPNLKLLFDPHSILPLGSNSSLLLSK